MRTGKARVARYRDIQQSLFDDKLVNSFQMIERADTCERPTVRVVYGSQRLADASDDSGSYCSSAFNETTVVVGEIAAATSVAEPASRTAPEPRPAAVSVVATSKRSAEQHSNGPHATGPHTKTVPAGARFESAISTHPRFEVAAGAEGEEPFAWRRFALGLAAGTAAGTLLLAVLGSY